MIKNFCCTYRLAFALMTATAYSQEFAVSVGAAGGNKTPLTAIPPLGDQGTSWVITVPSPAGASWTVRSWPDWAKVSMNGCLSSSQPFAYACLSVPANPGAARSGVMVISSPGHGTYGMNISQRGKGGSGIAVSVYRPAGPVSAIPAAGDGGASWRISVYSPPGGSWTVENLPDWATVRMNSCGDSQHPYSCLSVPANSGAARNGVLVLSIPRYGSVGINLHQFGSLGSGGCVPTPEQLRNRGSSDPVFANNSNFYPLPPIPADGHYCDPTFGTDVLVLTETTAAHNEGVDTAGQTGFNYDSTKFMAGEVNGNRRIYSIDPERLTASPGAILAVPFQGANLYIDAVLWSGDPKTPNRILVLSALQVYRADLKSDNTVDLASVTKITDVAPSLPADLRFERCSASLDTNTIGCGLFNPDWRNVGYVIFTLNGTVIHSVVNSGSSATQPNSYKTAGGRGNLTYSLWNSYKNGYKFYLDRTGAYAVFTLTHHYPVDPTLVPDPFNPFAILNLATKKFTFMQGGGHGDVGKGTWVGIGAMACSGCIKRWDFSKLTDDTTQVDYSRILGKYDYQISYPLPNDPNEGLPVSNFPTPAYKWHGALPVVRPVGSDGALQCCHASAAEYNNMFAEAQIYTVMYNGDNVVSDPGTLNWIQHPAFSDEVTLQQVACNPATQNCALPICTETLLPGGTPPKCLLMANIRLARAYHKPVSGLYAQLQPLQSRDGRFVAFSTNWSNTKPFLSNGQQVLHSQVMIVRVPQ